MQPTLPKTIFEVAKIYPRHTALLYNKDGKYRKIRYADLVGEVSILSSGLAGLGLAKGDRVGILSQNRPEWVIADLGCQNIGAISVPIHTTLSSKIIGYILAHSQAKVLFVSDRVQFDKVISLHQRLPDLLKIILIDSDEYADSENKIFSWSYFMKFGQKLSLSSKVEVTQNDTASIVYTSGTTGLPKGVVLSHYNFLSNIHAALSYIPVTHKDKLLSFLPLSHILERTAGYYAPMSRGATIAYAESVKTIARDIKVIKPSIIVSVPRIFEKFYEAIIAKVNASRFYKRKLFSWALRQEGTRLKRKLADISVFKKIRKSLGGRLRLTICGGAALNEKLAKFFSKAGILILEGYGLTETSPVVAVNKENKLKFGSVGIILPGVELKISDDKEILVRGPNVMQGYYHDNSATEAAIDSSGFFHTGDLGFLDSQGFLYIIGRKKEMMVTSGGKNIWPEVIEKLLNSDPYINQSMVIGHKRKCITALVVPAWHEVYKLAKEKNIDYRQASDLLSNPLIQKFFKDRIDRATADLPSYEKIIRFTLLLDEFSQERDQLTPTLKLRRATIADYYHKEIEGMYS